MFFNTKETPIVISIGGSLISPPQGIDLDFLKKLNTFIREEVKKGKRFFLIAGGGKIARHYRDAGKEVTGSLTSDDLDWLGIHATHLNGHLLRTIFKDIAHPRIVQNYEKKLSNWKEPVVIGAGWKPGWSTDYDAVILARDYRAGLIINLSNIDWIYDKDPAKHSDAKPIKKMTWSELEPLVGTKWSPGLNAPFDPVAAQLAKSLDLTVIIANGSDFDNLEKIVEGDTFKGTVITPYRIDASFYDREYYTGKKSEYRLGYTTSVIGYLLQTAANLYRAFLIRIFLNPKNCLDVGCGTGNLVQCLRWFGIEAFGVEISKDALEMADKSVKPYLKLGSIEKLPYANDEFDVVITFDVMEHVDRSKISQAVDETTRVSRKYIYHKIYTKENNWITFFHKTDYSHISVFSRKYWHKLFFENQQVSIPRISFFKLPTFFETVFVLRKK